MLRLKAEPKIHASFVPDTLSSHEPNDEENYAGRQEASDFLSEHHTTIKKHRQIIILQCYLGVSMLLF